MQILPLPLWVERWFAIDPRFKRKEEFEAQFYKKIRRQNIGYKAIHYDNIRGIYETVV